MSEAKEDNTALFALRDSWYARAKDMSLDALPAFMQELAEHKHDYNTICYAVAAAALAAAWAMNRAPTGGITGFQGGAVMWEFITQWQCLKNKPLKLVDYSDMLYPQYRDKFSKSISHATWDYLQAEAKRLAEDGEYAHSDVAAHWRSIAGGQVPFGYSVRD